MRRAELTPNRPHPTDQLSVQKIDVNGRDGGSHGQAQRGWTLTTGA